MMCTLKADASYCSTLFDIEIVKEKMYKVKIYLFISKESNKQLELRLKFFMKNHSYFCIFVIVFRKKIKIILAYSKIYLFGDVWSINLVQLTKFSFLLDIV